MEEEVVKVEKVEKEEKIGFIEGHPKTVFWSRFFLWTAFSCVLPFIFIAYRFELFQTVSKIQIGGWGLVAVIIVAVFVITLFKYVKKGLNVGYSLFGQCIAGFCKVILPLIALYVILYAIRNSLDVFMKVLGCVILCELVAIPLNPFPKWIWDRQKDLKETERKEGVDYFIDEFWKRKENSDKPE